MSFTAPSTGAFSTVVSSIPLSSIPLSFYPASLGALRGILLLFSCFWLSGRCLPFSFSFACFLFAYGVRVTVAPATLPAGVPTAGGVVFFVSPISPCYGFFWKFRKFSLADYH